ncbi:MAG: HD domain-containing protein [Theionarchaea archaeon]|nr:HD domain-containing protein [Theionarchaea archaeon]
MRIEQLYCSKKFLLRDPIHGYIAFDKEKYEFLITLMNSFEFQRLRRIKQLGTTSFVYPGGEHSRFNHSIGVTWLLYQFIKKFKEDGLELDDDIINRMLITSLIHDIGHGPFSHVFERITNYNHEEITLRFIKEKMPELIPAYSSSEIKKIFRKEVDSKNAWIGDLLDSQIDVDRMDFLLRDSHFTGVNYGRFDLERIFYSLVIGEIEGENHIFMLKKGLQAFEEFFISYHHMYWQVYFHEVTRSYEILLEKIFLRLKENLGDIDIELNEFLINFLSDNNPSLDNFFYLDDSIILETIKKGLFSRDTVLHDLCNRFLKRKMFQCIKKGKIESIDNILEMDKKIHEYYDKNGLSYKYYFSSDEPGKVAIERPVLERGLLMADIDKSGIVSGPFEFIDESRIIKSIYNTRFSEFRMYCPRNLVDDLKRLFA